MIMLALLNDYIKNIDNISPNLVYVSLIVLTILIARKLFSKFNVIFQFLKPYQENIQNRNKLLSKVVNPFFNFFNLELKKGFNVILLSAYSAFIICNTFFFINDEFSKSDYKIMECVYEDEGYGLKSESNEKYFVSYLNCGEMRYRSFSPYRDYELLRFENSLFPQLADKNLLDYTFEEQQMITKNTSVIDYYFTQGLFNLNKLEFVVFNY